MKSLRSLLVVALLATSAFAEPRQETLTLPRAIEIAMKQQPVIRQAQASIEAAEGRVDQARVARKPTVNLSASIGASSGRGDSLTGMTTSGFFDPFISTGLSAQIGWRIFDFGQTKANIEAAEANADAVRSQISTTNLDVETDVAIAFLEAVARQRLIAVAEATVKSEETHLDQARKFVAAQAKDPIEVAQAQARAANARSALASAQSDAALAMASLRSAIGWGDPEVSFVIDNQWPTPPTTDPAALPALVDSARKQRPEIVSADKQIAAAEASLYAARASNRPVLSASAQTQWGPDQNDWGPEPTWNAGLVLSWQIYDGGSSAASQRIANANLKSAQASRDALIISLTSELDAARARIVANRANVTASTEAVEAARAQLRLADARYTQGLGSQIELADAQTAVTTAEGNLIQAEWQLANAWALLRRALGGV
ncbi:MAG: TolC family protein [Kofleriaceae bacterium]